MLLFLAATNAFAGSATWNLNPTSNSWFSASNWTPATIPDGPADTATFAISNITNVDLEEGDIEVNGIIFNAGASPFTITAISFGSFPSTFIISGVGISNNSEIIQNFVAKGGYGFGPPGVIQFTNSATAGDLTVFTTTSDVISAGRIEFFDSSSAAHGTFINNGGPGSGNSTEFFDTSTADNAILIANGASGDGLGGVISFQNDSLGGTARVKVFGNGSLDISAHNAPGVTVGTIEGTGTVFLGANNLTVGNDHHGMIFSGVIQDSGAGGSLTAVGRRKLTLTNADTYSGGTTINGGNLFVLNKKGSATGSGAVQVNTGRLGGDGIIAGPVTVGTESGSDSFPELAPAVAPGDEGLPGTLTFLSTLTFQLRGRYFFDVNSDEAVADQIIANGVTIRTRSRVKITDLGPGILKNAELYDAGSGTWSATGSLGTALAGHTATLLQNGKVLVVGGASAELYDPASATWTTTGTLITPRGSHTATLLQNGKVLVAGGDGGGFPIASAELYDPATGIWTATGDMTTARYWHTATLLLNGKVLVVGYFSAGAELYDPATGHWTQTGPPITPSRVLFTATLLTNGKVLVAGGQSGSGWLASAELYDPVTERWAATRGLRSARSAHTATLLPSGMVLVTGGFDSSEVFSSAELYDPALGTWTGTENMATGRTYHTATLLTNGNVLVAGGTQIFPFGLASVELYDPASGNWTTTDSLDPGRYGHTATLLSDGEVLVAGGVGHGLPVGTVFTMINNTSTMPISGTFMNLPDGSTITVGGKNCQVSYSGGDGNDLTLTVVP